MKPQISKTSPGPTQCEIPVSMATPNNDTQQSLNHTSKSHQHQHHQRPHQSRRVGSGHRQHNHTNNKRQHASSLSSSQNQPQWDRNNYEQEEVDDLIVAAQYAFALPTPTESKQSSDMIIRADENEIDLDEEPIVASETQHDAINATANENNDVRIELEDNMGISANQNNGNLVSEVVVCDSKVAERDDDEDDDDDAESEVDLLEQLAHMVGDVDDGDDEDADDDDDDDDDDEDVAGGGIKNKNRMKKIRNKPMTVNEIDAYQADLHQIHDLLQNNVAIVETAAPTSQRQSSLTNPIIPSNKFPTIVPKVSTEHHLAGHIQHHMVDERTIVILSSPGGILLKEGTTLIMRQKDFLAPATIGTTNSDPSQDMLKKCDNTDSKILGVNDSSQRCENDIIPLGIILEIFGPVSQPLYSVRLPVPQSKDTVLVGKDATQPTMVENVDAAVSPDADKDATDTDINDLKFPGIAEEEASAEHAPHEEPIQVDPWCWSGEYTRIIRSSSTMLPVYYWNDPTSTNVFLDTEAVIRNSGRGCDASNLFDEEIIDVQDYSDDEQERVAKGSKNKRNPNTGSSSNAGSITSGAPPNNQFREQRSTNQRNQGKKGTYRMTPAPPQNHAPQFANVPWSGHMHPPPPGFHPNSTMSASAVHVGGMGVPYYPSYPTTNFYATPNPSGIPLNPSQFVPAHQGFYMPPPQFQQPWYYYNGSYQSVPPPPPPPPPPSHSSPQSPSSSQGGATDTVYYDFS